LYTVTRTYSWRGAIKLLPHIISSWFWERWYSHANSSVIARMKRNWKLFHEKCWHPSSIIAKFESTMEIPTKRSFDQL